MYNLLILKHINGSKLQHTNNEKTETKTFKLNAS